MTREHFTRKHLHTSVLNKNCVTLAQTTISTENLSTFNGILSKSGKFLVVAFRIIYWTKFTDQMQCMTFADCIPQTGNFLTYIVFHFPLLTMSGQLPITSVTWLLYKLTCVIFRLTGAVVRPKCSRQSEPYHFHNCIKYKSEALEPDWLIGPELIAVSVA